MVLKNYFHDVKIINRVVKIYFLDVKTNYYDLIIVRQGYSLPFFSINCVFFWLEYKLFYTFKNFICVNLPKLAW